MALDPRLAPGGMAELRETVAALHAAGIGVILDLVFNHTGESDALGPTLSLRGLDNRTYYRHVPRRPGGLVNDTGTGNTLACDHPVVRGSILDSLRHFVAQCRRRRLPLRSRPGARPRWRRLRPATRRCFDEIRRDPVARRPHPDRRALGYRARRLPARQFSGSLSSNGTTAIATMSAASGAATAGMVGALATRLAGSSDIFGGGAAQTRSVNFVAAHDGFTLADLVRL